MYISIARVNFLVVVMIFVSKTIYSQIAAHQPDSSTSSSLFAGNIKTPERIKWTWQLPASVKKAFNKSAYKDWFIEKVTKHHFSDKIYYRFCVHNGSLLDGDHFDSFLGKDFLDISDSGAILSK
jgi:hypothetical protein